MSAASGADPALLWTLRATLALLLLSAGVHKLQHLAAFRSALQGYRLLPPGLVAPAASALVLTELGLGVGLLAPGPSSTVALATAALFILYAAAIGVNLARGRRHIDCGCGGPAGRTGLSEALLARNAVLVAAACAAALDPSGRALVWVDGLSIGAGVSVLALLYAAADGLMAHASRLAPLRSLE
jgi:uncharacterized membrane protein YphA (DoxX/SURF4 family)